MQHIILIHGSFARGAPWTLPGSALPQSLQQATGGLAQTHRFDWSGKNSFAARHRATGELVARMGEILSADPQAAFHLVAHSHGGNLALQATRNEALQAHIHSIACLGTPVLVGREVAPTPGLQAASSGFFVLASALAYVAVDLSFWRSLSLAWFVLAALACLLFGLMLLMQVATLALPLHVGSVKHRLAEHFRRHVQVVLAQTAPPRIDGERVMFFRHPGDEASAASGPIHLLNWILGRVSMLLATYQGITERWLKHATDGTARASLYAFAYIALVALLGTASKAALLVGLFLPLAFVALCLALPIALHALRLVANLLLALFFGPEMVLAGYHVQVTAEATPSGVWRATLLNPAPSKARRAGVLPRASLSDDAFAYAHGRVYSDHRALADITRWTALHVAASAGQMQRPPPPLP